ncbi:MAG TPA: SgcJ/EcaC family oxidoreductase [Thermoanaerobaculia bacterium]|nr:SgcJ/EcaC family oxidoreductase [Thermoanaerobaculia bacterium]
MRRVNLPGLMAAALVFATLSPALAQKPAADPNRTRVEVLGKSFTTAFNRGDIPAVAALYATDAMALPPESETLKGRAAIEAMWKGVREMGVQSIEFTVLDVQSSGILMVETGKATMQVAGAGAAQATVSVKYVVVWKKQKDGTWKISHDIWNSLPTPAPTATPAPAG